jgi:hypothetical protein
MSGSHTSVSGSGFCRNVQGSCNPGNTGGKRQIDARPQSHYAVRGPFILQLLHSRLPGLMKSITGNSPGCRYYVHETLRWVNPWRLIRCPRREGRQDSLSFWLVEDDSSSKFFESLVVESFLRRPSVDQPVRPELFNKRPPTKSEDVVRIDALIDDLGCPVALC